MDKERFVDKLLMKTAEDKNSLFKVLFATIVVLIVGIVLGAKFGC